MSRTQPPKAETNDPLVRSMRETCAHFTDAAEDANFLARPFLVLLAELLCRIFGKIEDIVLLWRAGLIPPPAPKPAQPQRPRKARQSRRRTRTSRRTPGLRPHRRHQRSRVTHPTAIDRGQTPPRKQPPARRIDRYPNAKQRIPALNGLHTATTILLRYRNKLTP